MATLSPILDDSSTPGMRPLYAASLGLAVFLTFGVLAYVSIELTRNSGRWTMTALGEIASGRTMHDLLPVIRTKL